MSCKIGYCWLVDKKTETVKSVYVFEIIGAPGAGGTANVLIGNLKNLNPYHTVETTDWEKFDNDPTIKEVRTYVDNYRKGLVPINKETGRIDDIWIETIPQHKIMTSQEMTEYIKNSLHKKEWANEKKPIKQYELSVRYKKEGIKNPVEESSLRSYPDDKTAIKGFSKEIIRIRQNYGEVSYCITYNALIIKQGCV